MSIRNENCLNNRAIYVNREFLQLTEKQHIPSRVALGVLLPLACVEYDSCCNTEVKIPIDDFSEILPLSKAYDKRKNLNAYIRNVYTEAEKVVVDNVSIIDNFYFDAHNICIVYNEVAFKRFFQKTSSNALLSKSNNAFFTFFSNDIAKLVHCSYSWDMLKILSLKYDEKRDYSDETFSVKELVEGFGKSLEDYKRDLDIDYWTFEKKILGKVLEEVSSMSQFLVLPQKNACKNGSSETFFKRVRVRPKRIITNEPAHCYSIIFKKIALEECTSSVTDETIFLQKKKKTAVSANPAEPKEKFFPSQIPSLKMVMPAIAGVYIIHNESVDKYYVGQATNIIQRVGMHFSGRGNGDVYADYKYGPTGKGDKFSFKLVPLEGSDANSLNDLERYFIRKYDSFKNGYNKTSGNY